MTIEPKYDDLSLTPHHKLDLNPVRKFNWKSGGARDYWDPHIKRFRTEAIPEMAIRAVADDDHPQTVAPIRVGGDILEHLNNRANELELTIEPIEPHDRGGRTPVLGYPNIFDAGGERKDNFVIASTQEEASKFIHLATTSRPTEVTLAKTADMVGMPSCCLEFYVETALNQFNDPVYESACNTTSSFAIDGDRENLQISFPNPLLNTLWRYNGWRFIQHVPCSFECENSSQIAERNYDNIGGAGFEQEAEHVLSWLDLPTTWSGYHGLVNIRNAYSTGSYTTDDYWSEKILTWKREHQPKPGFEPNHNTDVMEPLDPDASVI